MFIFTRRTEVLGDGISLWRVPGNEKPPRTRSKRRTGGAFQRSLNGRHITYDSRSVPKAGKCNCRFFLNLTIRTFYHAVPHPAGNTSMVKALLCPTHIFGEIKNSKTSWTGICRAARVHAA